MRPEDSQDTQNTTAVSEPKWKAVVLGAIFLAGFLASLLYVNAFASIGESIAVGVLAGLLALVLMWRSRMRATPGFTEEARTPPEQPSK